MNYPSSQILNRFNLAQTKILAYNSICSVCIQLFQLVVDPWTFLWLSVNRFNIATGMAWAGSRQTTLIEYTAYCFFGIFSITMPLLYEEGEMAFRRLGEEISKRSPDPTILAYCRKRGDPPEGLFARRPDEFIHIFPAIWDSNIAKPETCTTDLSDDRLAVNLLMCRVSVAVETPFIEHWAGLLECTLENEYLSRPAIPLSRPIDETEFCRKEPNLLYYIHDEKEPKAEKLKGESILWSKSKWH